MNVNIPNLHAAVVVAPTRTPTSDRPSRGDRVRSSYLPEVVPIPDVPEVLPPHDHEGLRPVQAEKILVQEKTIRIADDGKEYSPRQSEVTQVKKVERRKICGIAPWMFWAFGAVLFVVVAGVVTGVVISQKHSFVKSSTPRAGANTHAFSATVAPSPTAISSTPSRTINNASITTTQPVNPISTLDEDCPSIEDTIYTYVLDSTTPSQQFRQRCGQSTYNLHGWSAVVNVATDSLSSCLELCGAWNLANESPIRKGESRICNSACWRNSLDTQFPGQCFGYTTRNVSGHFNVSVEAICDSGYLMNQNVILR